MLNPEFSNKLLNWFHQHGRHDLPWQQDINPYRVWVSEIMLQQTQVKTVIPYYQRFMQRFPNVASLAAAEIDDVLNLWTGLGYYARGRNLHKAAIKVMREFQGEFPDSLDEMINLPGVGRSTAAAVLAISKQQHHAILDGNVKRVLARMYAVQGWPGDKHIADKLWQKAEQLTPKQSVADYTQAIMDFGATVCTRSKPGCGVCVFQAECKAFQQNAVSEFPNRKPKKTKPVKSTIFLICQNSTGQTLLQQRPPTGIWGGLWSFPEANKLEDVHSSLEQHLNLKVLEQHSMTPFRHTFSHYHMDVQPLLIKTKAMGNRISDHATMRWLDYSETQSLGLAAPVKKLLENLEEQRLENLYDANRSLRKAG